MHNYRLLAQNGGLQPPFLTSKFKNVLPNAQQLHGFAMRHSSRSARVLGGTCAPQSDWARVDALAGVLLTLMRQHLPGFVRIFRHCLCASAQYSGHQIFTQRLRKYKYMYILVEMAASGRPFPCVEINHGCAMCLRSDARRSRITAPAQLGCASILALRASCGWGYPPALLALSLRPTACRLGTHKIQDSGLTHNNYKNHI